MPFESLTKRSTIERSGKSEKSTNVADELQFASRFFSKKSNASPTQTKHISIKRNKEKRKKIGRFHSSFKNISEGERRVEVPITNSR